MSRIVSIATKATIIFACLMVLHVCNAHAKGHHSHGSTYVHRTHHKRK